MTECGLSIPPQAFLNTLLAQAVKGKTIWLYSHWSGCFMAEFARVAPASLHSNEWRASPADHAAVR